MDTISRSRERPSYRVNFGIYVLASNSSSGSPKKRPRDPLPELAEGRLFGFKSRAYWRPVDSIKDLKEAERELMELVKPPS
jgi:NDP-sugar pyrophosphorylase family protein